MWFMAIMVGVCRRSGVRLHRVVSIQEWKKCVGAVVMAVVVNWRSVGVQEDLTREDAVVKCSEPS